MSHDSNPTAPEAASHAASTARRREVLRRLGQTSLAAGLAAPAAAFAGGGRRWCRQPTDQTKCVHASISGMGSILLSAHAGNEVCSRKVSYYCNQSNWGGGWTGAGGGTIACDTTKFKDAFGCAAGALDSGGKQQSSSDCLLNKTLLALCTNYPNSYEAHWVAALANANNLAAPTLGAAFPYSPLQVVGYYQTVDPVMRSSAYTFFSQYCEQYA